MSSFTLFAFVYSGGMYNKYLSCTRRVSHVLLELWFLKLRQSLPLLLPIVQFIYGRLFFHLLVEVSPKFTGLNQSCFTFMHFRDITSRLIRIISSAHSAHF